MNITTNQMRTVIFTAIAPMLVGSALIATIPARAGQEVTAADPAAFYKAKCVACHGAKAEKKFDATLPDEQLFDAILKGKKVEKPPNMPGYESKGVTADQAKALVAHMKELKATP